MNKITCLSKNLNEFFNEKADEISIETEKKEEIEWFIICNSLDLI